ncbi:hypothetical protein [Paenibacillus sp. J2TS4]|uniref:hypothetical protein n=1 Tax=Paenibacillus sp. J2TS4 TaxID=2807194 RepID=UPI001B2C061F|nr:hypothetical protein [Paenibacillus sp. J2TS4]GIP32888.1 hypothetical protein J2TS4_20980 [Paenibacillus sp. J2TS4]
MQTNNQQMTSDRSMISEKELLYMKDYLSWELLAMKKCNESANLCTDPQLKQLIKQVGEKHKQHYQTILSQLQ